MSSNSFAHLRVASVWVVSTGNWGVSAGETIGTTECTCGVDARVAHVARGLLSALTSRIVASTGEAGITNTAILCAKFASITGREHFNARAVVGSALTSVALLRG